MNWFKSTRSNASGNCVEVATQDNKIHVRDSKDPDGPMLSFDQEAWREFISHIKAS